jgi:hypothetical protein
VEGPDGKAATAIANQLSTGQAKLANINGKQVPTNIFLGSVSDPHWLYADPDTDSGKI